MPTRLPGARLIARLPGSNACWTAAAWRTHWSGRLATTRSTEAFGGFCYFNSAAIAAHHLSKQGKVAMLDIDYHHGNGAQDIFYRRTRCLYGFHSRHTRATPIPISRVLKTKRVTWRARVSTSTCHCPRTSTGRRYRKVLTSALETVSAMFNPQFLVLALGLDTAKGDPTGSFPADGQGLP